MALRRILVASIVLLAVLGALGGAVAASDPANQAALTYPLNGATGVDTSQPFTWSSAEGAQAYYLYVGTTQGASDVFDSRQLDPSVTQITPSLLPGQTLWARMWTKDSAGQWSYYDSSFSTSSSVPITEATLTYPTNGATLDDPTVPFSWTAVPDAQAYYLYIGTSQGAQDLFDSAQLTVTSVTPPPLPTGTTTWARIWTKRNNTWTFRDVSFVADYSFGVLTYPGFGLTNVDLSQPFHWTPVVGATSYELQIGASQGVANLFDSGPITGTQVTVPANLPSGQQLWARVLTTTTSGTRSVDRTFGAAAAFTNPLTGSLDVATDHAFAWSPSPVVLGTAPIYDVSVGRAPGTADLYDTGPIATNSTSVPASALPVNTVLYAQLTTTLGDQSTRRASSVFMVTGSSTPEATLVSPTDGQADFSTADPLVWTPVGVAQAYRLQILSNGHQVRDSGPVWVTEYFAEDLPVGDYTARLGTEIAGTWTYTDRPFSVASTGASMASERAAARRATDSVRQMADAQGNPYAGTPLYQMTVTQRSHQLALCTDYALTLLTALSQENLAARLPQSDQPRRLDIAFISGAGDTHTLVEFFDTDQQQWTILDPTFDLVPVRTSDGLPAATDDVHNATVAQDWSAITYDFLGTNGDLYARNYYLDYPLLYLVRYSQGQVLDQIDPRPYMTQLSSLPNGTRSTYWLSSDESPVLLTVDGQTESLTCSLAGLTCAPFKATTISQPAGSAATVTAWQPPRHVF